MHTWSRSSSRPVELLILLGIAVEQLALRGDDVHGLYSFTCPSPVLYGKSISYDSQEDSRDDDTYAAVPAHSALK